MIRSLILSVFLLLNAICSNAQHYSWAHYFGKASVYGICLDSSENLYSCGYFMGTVNFNNYWGGASITKSSTGVFDAYIAKYDNNGDLLKVLPLGATGGQGQAICVKTDYNKNVIVSGYYTDSLDFDPGPAYYFMHSKGSANIFLEKLDSAGNFLWAKTYKARSMYEGTNMVIDKMGNIYYTGHLDTTIDFNPGGSGGFVYSGGVVNNFILKLDKDGNFLWVDTTQCSASNFANCIAIDKNGNLLLTGDFGGTIDFDPGPGIYNLSDTNGSLFVEKLDSNGHFIWAENMGTASGVSGTAIDVDETGNIAVAGYLHLAGDFDPGPGTLSFPGEGMFTLKLDSSGHLIWGKFYADPPSGFLAEPTGIIHDKMNAVYRVGMYANPGLDFDPGTVYYNPPYLGVSYGFFVDKLDSNGNFQWARGMGNAYTNNIVVDKNNSLYFCGTFTHQTRFNPEYDSLIHGFVPDNNGFIEKFDTICPTLTITQTGNVLSVSALPFITGENIPMFIWINCITGDTVYSSSSALSYTTIASGTYKLVAVTNFCASESNCVTVTYNSVNNVPVINGHMKLYPVPATNNFTIVTYADNKDASILAYDLLGRQYRLPYSYSGNNLVADCSSLHEGNYIIKVNCTDGSSFVGRMLISAEQ